MPRFVVLTHDFPLLHWDFMLEKEAALRTWRLAREPVAAEPIDAELLPEHRLAYLDYEGPVSGNRGSVARWDAGSYRLHREAPDLLEVELEGGRLRGIVVLRRRGDSNSNPELYLFQWFPDSNPPGPEKSA